MAVLLRVILAVLISLTLVACEDQQKVDPLALGELASVTSEQLEVAVSSYKKSSKSAKDKYELGYALVAFSYTRTPAKSSGNESPGRGVVASLRNIAEFTKQQTKSLKKHKAEKPLREKALEKGLTFWAAIAEKGHLQAQI
jgi:hypothetical protein